MSIYVYISYNLKNSIHIRSPGFNEKKKLLYLEGQNSFKIVIVNFQDYYTKKLI